MKIIKSHFFFTLFHNRPRWRPHACRVPLTLYNFSKTHLWSSRDMTIFRVLTGRLTQKTCEFTQNRHLVSPFCSFCFMLLVLLMGWENKVFICWDCQIPPWAESTIKYSLSTTTHISQHDLLWCPHYRYKFVAELEDLYLDPNCATRRSFDFVDHDDMVVTFGLVVFTPSDVSLFWLT